MAKKYKCPNCNARLVVKKRSNEEDDAVKTLPNLEFIQKIRFSKPGVLVLMEGQCEPETIRLQQGINSIGRKSPLSHSTIQLDTPDSYISKYHINIHVVIKPDGTFEHQLSDNNSTNGTYHNQERIEAEDIFILQPDDLIRIGHTTFKFLAE